MSASIIAVEMSTQPPATRSEKPDNSSLIIAIIAFLLFAASCLWLFKTKWPLGVQNEWVIKPNANSWPRGAWGLPVACFYIIGGFAALCAYDRFKRAKNRREQITSTRLCLLGISLLTLLWPWALLGPGGTGNLIDTQWSDISNGYFGAAYQVHDARQFSSEYAAIHQHPESIFQAHVATHPPGAVLFDYFARRSYEAVPMLQSVFTKLAVSLSGETIDDLASRAQQIRLNAPRAMGIKSVAPDLPHSAIGGALWCAFIISLCLALTTPAVYLIASSSVATTQEKGYGEESHSNDSHVFAGETRGLLAAALWALAPTLNLFAFTHDAIIAAGTTWTLAFFALRLRGGKPFWMVATGAVLTLTSFVSFGVLAVAVTIVVALILFYRRDWRAMMREVSLLGAGFFGAWISLTLIFPMHPLVVFSQAMQVHHDATGSRSHLPWTFFNILTFMVFCGWPTIAVSLIGWKFISWKTTDESNPVPRIPLCIGLAAVITIVMLSLSVKVMGEVERLWMFLAPPICILAATYLARRTDAIIIGVLLSLQASQTLLMAAWLTPLVRPF